MAERSDLIGDVSRALEIAPEPDRDGDQPLSLQEAREAKQAARRAECLSLKVAGLTDEQIAARMKISVSGVRDMIARTLTRATNLAAEEMRDLENARLDRAQSAIWTKVLNGDEKAIDVYLRISQRRAKLNGLDAPTRINLSLDVRREMEEALAALEQTVLGEVISRVDQPYDPAVDEG